MPPPRHQHPLTSLAVHPIINKQNSTGLAIEYIYCYEVKLIDYISEMGHEQEERIDKYERDIYELRGEVEYLGQRNVSV